jgi:hypothetical protein
MDRSPARLRWLVGALVLAGCASIEKPPVTYFVIAPPPPSPPLSASLPPPLPDPEAPPVPPPTPEEPPVTGVAPAPLSPLRRTLRTPPPPPAPAPAPRAPERPAAAAPPPAAPPAPPAAPAPAQVASVPPAHLATTPPPVLAPQLSAEEEDRLTQKARSQIEGAEKVLGQIEKSRLRRGEQSTLDTVLDFLAKAREAMAGRDYQRAATLADKARVLAEDLTRGAR